MAEMQQNSSFLHVSCPEENSWMDFNTEIRQKVNFVKVEDK
jgi:dTDP-4-dehydrorhamnose reductase